MPGGSAADLEAALREQAAVLGLSLAGFFERLGEERRARISGPFSAALAEIARGWRGRRSIDELLREIEERQRGSERPEVI